jgi:hypothetical protein
MYADPGSTRSFSATPQDQFGTALSLPTTFTWATTGGGTLSPQGQLTANASVGGPYTVTASSGSISGRATLIVQSLAPVALDQDLSVAGGMPTPLTLQATDANQDPLTYQVVTGPVYGTLSGTPPMLTYTPTTGYLGADSLTFTARSSAGTSNVATVAISDYGQVNAQNSSTTALIKPAFFDAAQWSTSAAYQTTYLQTIEPSRIWSTAVGGPGVPSLTAVGSRHLKPAAGTPVTISAMGAPGAPVTFMVNGLGIFNESQLNTATVRADATGLAQVTYVTPDGGRFGILAASPLAVGHVRWFVAIIPAAYLVNPVVPNE